MPKPLKFHQTLNLAPRSLKHGKYRRAGPAAHGRSAVGTDNSTGGADETVYVTVTWNTRWVTFYSNDYPGPKPPAIPNAGIRTGELIGHRLWWVIKDAGEDWLCSLAHRQLWKPAETIAGDTNQIVDQAWYPIWGGTYSFSDRSPCVMEGLALGMALSEWERHRAHFVTLGWSPYEETKTFVIGTIKMWGDVVEHERGYRAEFAKLNSIDEMIGPGNIETLRARYGVCEQSST